MQDVLDNGFHAAMPSFHSFDAADLNNQSMSKNIPPY
jgi:hypothetical protein